MDSPEPSICCQRCASQPSEVADDPDKPPGHKPYSLTSHLNPSGQKKSVVSFPQAPLSCSHTPHGSLPTNQQLRHRERPRKQSQIPQEIPRNQPSNESNPTQQGVVRSSTLSFAKIAILLIAQLPLRAAHPISHLLQERSDTPHVETELDFWINMGLSSMLVLLGGVFAGLTLGLMGQDEIYLQVIQQSGEASERKAAGKVLDLLKRGKHWVLVTLLLGNVITNETLPIVLDRCLGGGWPAVVSSTVAIVIFGEIIPQSVSVRYGLGISAAFATFVLYLMYLMFPVAYPIALILDYTLGENHGTMYKRAGLKTLVTLHKTMGVERLSDDEVTIISAVLDLKDKLVAAVMTPIEDVYTLSSDRILDEPTIEEILHAGFNRIPIHAPGEPTNFIGMLLVRTLITYDPEDAFVISSFPLATLPETGPDTSCLNILNYFQEGKSHMIVVSNTPGAPTGAIGVLTLEDVIEELIGEEIIDESDVYVDVHRAIKRESPNTEMKRVTLHSAYTPRSSIAFDNVFHALVAQNNASPGGVGDGTKPKLNPLNKASNPKATTNSKVTIKPGLFAATDGDIKMAQFSVTEIPIKDVHHQQHTAINAEPTINLRTGINIGGGNGNGNGNGNGSIRRTESESAHETLQHMNQYDSAYNVDRTPNSSPSFGQEFQSYRTGSIIESVVNFHGVNKTIIEVDDNVSSSGSVSSRSSMKWRRSDEEALANKPLLLNDDND